MTVTMMMMMVVVVVMTTTMGVGRWWRIFTVEGER